MKNNNQTPYPEKELSAEEELENLRRENQMKDKVAKDLLPSSAANKTAGNIGSVAHASSGNLAEATEALIVLGYDRSSVIKALGGIDPTLDVGMIIKAALKKLAR